MENFQEVEKRIILSAEQKDRVIKDLKDMGAKFIKDQIIEDDYFCNKKYKSFAETAMKEVGSYGLRIRKKQEGSQTKYELNIKVITQEDDHHSWEEHEVSINSGDEMTNILKALNQKSFFRYKKERHIYRLKGLEVLIEDIENFGPIIEIEAKTTIENSEKMQKKIINLLEDLKLNPSDVVPKSVTYILMEKGSKF